jgi:hypothetical protein
MTGFEYFFASLKKVLNNKEIYGLWPDFEPEYDKREHAWTNLKGLGDVLLLNCGQCDGPSDMRHNRCKTCVEQRKDIAKTSYKESMGQLTIDWPSIILCRIYTE